jgi:hypothetical protein
MPCEVFPRHHLPAHRRSTCTIATTTSAFSTDATSRSSMISGSSSSMPFTDIVVGIRTPNPPYPPSIQPLQRDHRSRHRRGYNPRTAHPPIPAHIRRILPLKSPGVLEILKILDLEGMPLDMMLNTCGRDGLVTYVPRRCRGAFTVQTRTRTRTRTEARSGSGSEGRGWVRGGGIGGGGGGGR